MLKNEEIKKIENFVYLKPRSIQEIAELIDKNWRTADRYVQDIEKDFGTITTRVFREGTRGALKIVYWNSVEKISHSAFQEKLEKDILDKTRKEDFPAFDIFQHVSDRNKKAIIEKEIKEDTINMNEFAEILSSAKKQLLIFSGNLSFINLKNKTIEMTTLLEKLAKSGVDIKIICRVDVAGRQNIEKILAINHKLGKEMIEIRHREQPLRAFVVDGKIFRMKEMKEATGKLYELDKKIYIFYTIRDKDWAEWLSKIFWKMYSSSIGADKRLEELNKLAFKN